MMYTEYCKKSNGKHSTTLEVGKWVTFKEEPKHIGFVTKIEDGRYFYYGLNTAGVWVEDDWYSLNDVSKPRPATDKKVEQALIAEAKRKGVWNVPIICCNGKEWKNKCKIQGFLPSYNKLWSTYGPVFINGQWAEILSDPTKDKITKGKSSTKKSKFLI